MTTVRELIDRYEFFDAAVLHHGWVDYMRDYEIIVGNLRGPRDTDIHRYHFVGCAEASCQTALDPAGFKKSLPDDFVLSGPDYPEKDDPDGFIWGVRWAPAYPGLTYVTDGTRAWYWSQLLGRNMHEVLLEINAHTLRLVFADFRHAVVSAADWARPKDYPMLRTLTTGLPMAMSTRSAPLLSNERCCSQRQ